MRTKLLASTSFAALLAMSAASTPVFGQATKPAASAVTAEALVASKLDQLLVLSANHDLLVELDMSENMLGKLDELEEAGVVAKGKLAPVRDAVKKSLGGKELQADLRTRLLLRVDAAQLDAALAFYSSPLGKRYGATGAKEPDGEQVEAWFTKQKPSDARMAKVRALIEASSGYDGMKLLLLAPARGLVEVFAALAPEKKVTDAQIEAQFLPMLEMMKPEIEKLLAYLMRDFSDAEMDELVAFEKTPAGRWFHQALFGEAAATLGQAFATVGSVMAKAVVPAAPTKP